MAKKVSTDEKLTKIIDFFQSGSEVFTLKELEKKLPKSCNFSAMLVKELLGKLLDDNLINVEKCGATNLYWRFRYAKHHFYLCEKEKADLAIESYREENEKMASLYNKLKDGRKDSGERMEIFEEYSKLKAKVGEIEGLKMAMSTNSPEEFSRMNEDIESLVRNINKTTDDIFTLQGYVCDKFNLERKTFLENFDVEEDMDYIE